MDHRERTVANVLTEREAAVYIGMSPSFLSQTRLKIGAQRLGTPGPPFLKIGRAVRYRRADLDTWLRERRRLAPSHQEG